jgi:hypothetical protein
MCGRSEIGGLCKGRQLERFDALERRVLQLRIKKFDHEPDFTEAEKCELERQWICLRTNFPADRSLVLLTRFGNSIGIRAIWK